MREAKKLKSSHENIELLKEKLLEEKRRRERAETDLCKLQELPSRLNTSEKELSTWKQLMNDIPGVVRPEDIPNEFSILQKYVSCLFFCFLLLSSYVSIPSGHMLFKIHV